MSNNPLKKVLYENYRMLSPNGELICMCSKKKMLWYVKREIAKLNSDQTSFTLLFEPKGNGQEHPFYKQAHSNKCVSCGSTKSLNRHHIVPYCYRKYFPKAIKEFSSYDILPLCIDCHSLYETKALEVKKQLVSILPDKIVKQNLVEYKVSKLNNLVNAIQRYKNQIPSDTLNKYFDKIKLLSNNTIHEDNIHEIIISKPKFESDELRSEEIVNFYLEKDQLDELILLWRKHFINILKPQFLPSSWEIDYISFK